MERKKYFTCLIFCGFCLILFSAQNTFGVYRKEAYQAYVDGRITVWEEIIDTMENQPDQSVSFRMELVNYYYGYTGYLMGSGKNKEAKECLQRAKTILETVLSEFPNDATATAYMGAFLGYELNISKMKAPALGPKSLELINRSIALDPKNPQGYIERANSLYYLPELLGGSKKEAIHYWIRALKLFEENKDVRYNWLYLKVLTDLAVAYEETGVPEEALRLYERILRIEPDYVWVKEELYPALLEKMKEAVSKVN